MNQKAPSIAIGAAVYVVLSLGLTLVMSRSGGGTAQSLLGCAGCLVILIGPLAAVWHYTTTHRLTILPAEGAVLGALAGTAGALVSSLLQLGLVAAGLFPSPAEMLEQQRQQMLEEGMEPAQIDQAMGFAEAFGGGNPLMGIVIGVVIAAALGALVGALGATMFKRGGAEPPSAPTGTVG